MTQQEILATTRAFIKNKFSGDGTGHDFFHVQRVVNAAKTISEKEHADLFLVELSAWLHDLGDYKLNGGVDRSEELIIKFLSTQAISSDVILKVVEIVSQVSFSKGKVATTLEAKIVQDADRLDAIGAIGIARAFAYGGSKNRELWNPENPGNSTIQHFHDKLLKLKNLMNTETAKRMASNRHQVLVDFINRFDQEWNGKA